MTDPVLIAQYTRLASKVSARAVTISADQTSLAAMLSDCKTCAQGLQDQASKLTAAAPVPVPPPAPPAAAITAPSAQELVAWIDQTIVWAGDIVSLANNIDWSGWLNWFITDINSMTVDLQNLANWVSANAAAIDNFETVVNDVLTIISGASAMLAIL
jgi:hypothetical protein